MFELLGYALSSKRRQFNTLANKKSAIVVTTSNYMQVCYFTFTFVDVRMEKSVTVNPNANHFDVIQSQIN